VLAIDEAGKCPVLGSIWVVGIVMHDEFANKMYKDGYIDDCKKLSRARIDYLKPELEWAVDKKYVRRLTPEIIDIETKDELNLNAKEMIVVMNIIDSALRDFPDIQKIYVDNFEVSLEMFKKRKAQIGYDFKNYKHLFVIEHQADEKYPPVMVASIFAKYYRQREEYEFYDVAGSGNPCDKRTLNYIKAVLSGEIENDKWIRHSWITVRRLKRDEL